MTDFRTLQQHQLLTRLLDLARQQGQALAARGLDDFLSLMDTREGLIADLVALEQAPAPANILPFPTIAAGVDADAKDAMRGLIRSILAQDEENEQTLREQMDELQGTIVHINHGTVAGRRYAASLAGGRSGAALDRAC